MDSTPPPHEGRPPAQPSIISAPGTSPAASAIDSPSPQQPQEFGPLDDYLGPPIRRRRGLPLVLFLATCFFTYAAGTYEWRPTVFGLQDDGQGGERWDLARTWHQLRTNWQDGLIYMGCVMAILLAHEMGHFLMTVRYHVPASYPIFLPVPIMLTGTMGAVIGMEGFRANRRQMFDIGLAGPLAGLVLTVPMVWIGIKMGNRIAPQNAQFLFGDPLLPKWIAHLLGVNWSQNGWPHNPIYMAGWVGMFVTGLNMMPVSQLDGGHVIYALFLKRGHWIARTFLLSAMAFVVISGQYSWTLMVVLVTLIGVDHPPTADDRVPLGPVRIILGTLSLALPVLCFTPFRLVAS
jgi:Zn-dependent protease